MDKDKAFARAILDAPQDIGRRLVFADWLDAHGDPRGEYIRAVAERRRGDPASMNRLDELRKAIAPGWLPLLDCPPPQEQGWQLRAHPQLPSDLPVAQALQHLASTAAGEEFAVDL